jgi:glycosyltransferase involved in cell wall biosynthesis
MLTLPTYALITPARNEAQFIESTIQSVIAQTVRPMRWVIVSDGSTDGTDEIVGRYAAQHEWIQLVRLPERSERHFAGKVLAFNAGLASLKGVAYQVISNLDADITFDSGYFEFLLGELARDLRLGVVGTPYKDASSEIYDYRFVSAEDVAGACQVFRRACFEEIGGYVPIKGGSIDTVAVTTARMKGWKTRSFTEMISVHHRNWGTAQCGPLRAIFNNGMRDYAQGNHPLWQFVRCIYQMRRKPVLVRGVILGTGYIWAGLRRKKRPVSREFVEFRQREQMQRLVRMLKGKLGAHPSPDKLLQKLESRDADAKP